MKTIERAKYKYRTEGLLAFIKSVFSFASRFIYESKVYYIIEHRPLTCIDNSISPPVQNCVLRIIEAQDIINCRDPLVKKFIKGVADAREKLESGAIAFCIFIDDQLANIGWIALTEKARKSLFQPPFAVNFEAGEASTGGGWTMPRFRKNRLFTYSYYLRLKYIWDRHSTVVFAAVLANNRAAFRMHVKFNPLVRGKGRQRKILWHRSWKEIPVNMELSRLTDLL